MTKKTILFCSGIAGLLLAASTSVSAVLIYDNSANDLGVRFTMGNNVQYGDELALAGTDRQMQSFSFEYWGTSVGGATFAGNVQARVRLYVNDGALSSGYASPGTVFFDSSWFSVDPTARQTIVFQSGVDWSVGGLLIPASDITLAVEFQGLAAGDEAGVDIYSPPTVGTSFNDYWENVGTDASPVWQLKAIQGVPVNFASQIDATSTAAVPEAFGTFGGLLLGLGLLAFTRSLSHHKRFALLRN